MADLKQIARRIFHETLAAIDIPAVMQRKLRVEGTLLRCESLRMDLAAFSKIRAIAVGKAAHAMVGGFVSLLPPELKVEGIVAAPTPPTNLVAGFRYFL